MNKLKLTTVFVFLPYIFFGQYLSKERETEIKMSEKYYWGECSDFRADEAREYARRDLCYSIIGDAVNQSIKRDEVLKTIELGIHVDSLQQKGKKVRIIAWIAKDSVRIIFQTQGPDVVPVIEVKPDTIATDSSAIRKEVQPDTIVTDSSAIRKEVPDTINPAIRKLAECKNYNEVIRVATGGFIRGSSKDGFSDPEKCIIAVFTKGEKTLSALLYVGDASRVDLMSGKTIQNYEQYYSPEEYFLLYLQQRN
jgi:hypothetical protein